MAFARRGVVAPPAGTLPLLDVVSPPGPVASWTTQHGGYNVYLAPVFHRWLSGAGMTDRIRAAYDRYLARLHALRHPVSVQFITPHSGAEPSGDFRIDT